jgi:hypothetical protein
MQTMQSIAAEYHSGQFSPLYAFASTGTIQPGLQAEIRECLVFAASKREYIRLTQLYAATAPQVSLEVLQSHRPSEFWHRTQRNADGSPVRCRVNGKLKTWKTRPDSFRLPVKHGIKQCFYITPENAAYWVLAPQCNV